MLIEVEQRIRKKCCVSRIILIILDISIHYILDLCEHEHKRKAADPIGSATERHSVTAQLYKGDNLKQHTDLVILGLK